MEPCKANHAARDGSGFARISSHKMTEPPAWGTGGSSGKIDEPWDDQSVDGLKPISTRRAPLFPQ